MGTVPFLPRQFGVVQFQLRTNRLIVGQRVGAVGRGRLDEMDQDARPFDVPQELVPEADAFVGALDQAGDVGHDERTVGADLHEAQIGMLGGKRIGGDFGPGVRQAAQERAFAGVRFADQPHVGDHLEFEPQGADLAGLAGGGFARARLTDDLKRTLPLPPLPPKAATTRSPSAARSLSTMPCWASITMVPGGTGITRSSDERPWQLAPAPGWPAGGLVLFALGQRGEAIDALLGHEDDAAAVAAVAAVGSAAGDIFLPPEADAAVAPLARFNSDFDFVDKHFHAGGRLKRRATMANARVTGTINRAKMRKYQSGVKLMPQNVSLYSGVI